MSQIPFARPARVLVCGFALALLLPAAVRAQDAAAVPAYATDAAAMPDVLRWWEGARLFAGLDGSKQPQDLGINANMGARVSADIGVPLTPTGGLGLQLGAATNLSDAAVHVLDQIEGTSRRTQTFVTLGVYQRLDRQGLTWTLGYDWLLEHYYDRVRLEQVRGSAGYRVTRRNEVGAWFTKSVRGEDAVMGGVPVRLDPISQLNGYLAHTWPMAARTTFWAGVASGHQNVVWVLPDNSRDSHVLVYGAQLELPLSDRVAVTGSANFLTPTATGTVDAALGLTFFPGRHPQIGPRAARLPVQDVANNPSFATNMRRY